MIGRRGGGLWRRRDVLAGLAGGAAWATLAACGKPGLPPLALPPAGELVGANAARGHRLRDAAPAVASGAAEEVDVAIVGGGAAGLAAAWRLRGAGIDRLAVLELEDALGGTARGGVLGDQACPWGAHYVAAPRREDRALVRLLGELGALEADDGVGEPVVREELLVREPEERLFYKGSWSEGLFLSPGATSKDRAELARFTAEVARWVAFRDAQGRRAFDLPVARCSDDAAVQALDRVSMAAWLDAHDLRSSRLRWFVEYACRDDYGATCAQVSAWAGLFYFASRVGAAGDESAPLVTWPDGNGRLIAHLAERVGAPRLRRGLTVVDVAPQAEGEGGGVRLAAVDPAGTPIALRARHVILAVPQFIAARIFAPWRAARPSHVDAFAYGAWLVANLAIAERPRSRGTPLAWDNVLYEGDGLGYVVATHQEGKDRGPTVFTYYRPFLDDDPAHGRAALFAGDWATWARAVLDDLRLAHPTLACTRMDIVRWGHAMVRPAPGLMFGGARQAAMTPVGPVHFAHTELSGLALFEEALDHGLRAAEEILAARGDTSPTWR